jgi:hypothetical protein
VRLLQTTLGPCLRQGPNFYPLLERKPTSLNYSKGSSADPAWPKLTKPVVAINNAAACGITSGIVRPAIYTANDDRAAPTMASPRTAPVAAMTAVMTMPTTVTSAAMARAGFSGTCRESSCAQCENSQGRSDGFPTNRHLDSPCLQDRPFDPHICWSLRVGERFKELEKIYIIHCLRKTSGRSVARTAGCLKNSLGGQ